ncbi:MAG: ABC transporter ATP-binding protein [Candidatus Hermodarchaeota archaeon]
MVSVQLQGIQKAFSDLLVLKNIDLQIPDGQILAILGSSGSGKTTLLRILAGILVPDAGKIYFGIENVTYKKAAERNVGYVPQALGLFPHLSVSRNIAFGLEARKMPREQILKRVQDLLILGEIEDLGERFPHQISGGQKQRVALLRALAPEPQILLLDEPLSALDTPLKTRLQHEIKRIQEKTRTTTVYVTHDETEALSIADSVAIINHGIIEQAGAPNELGSKCEICGFRSLKKA